MAISSRLGCTGARSSVLRRGHTLEGMASSSARVVFLWGMDTNRLSVLYTHCLERAATSYISSLFPGTVRCTCHSQDSSSQYRPLHCSGFCSWSLCRHVNRGSGPLYIRLSCCRSVRVLAGTSKQRGAVLGSTRRFV